MKVFLSWSGEQSRRVAEAIRDWLPNVHQRVEVFFSPNDVEKGAKWSNEIDLQLRDTRFCIVCLTPEALQSSWINFEAGAISKGIGQNRIAPLLLNLAKSDVSGPLSLFQLADFAVDDIRHVVRSLNNAFEEDRLSEDLLGRAFDRWWPDLDRSVSEIIKNSPAKSVSPKPQREVIDETLLNTREIIRQMSGLRKTSPNQRAISALAAININVTKLYEIIDAEEFVEGINPIQSLGRKMIQFNSVVGKTGGGSLVKLRSWVRPLRVPGAPALQVVASAEEKPGEDSDADGQ
jgi:hypothetical protein